MSTVLQIRSNGQITLPTSIRRQARLKEGDLLEVLVEEDGSLRLVPKIAIDRDQAYFWTERWQKGERETEEDLRAGRYKQFTSMDEMIKDLESKE
jgi:AbrB family looped-hinge helix DNA binding protein